MKRWKKTLIVAVIVKQAHQTILVMLLVTLFYTVDKMVFRVSSKAKSMKVYEILK